MNSKRRNAQHKNSTGSLAPKLAAYSATAAAALAFAPNAHAQIINITSFNYSGNTNTTTPPSFAPNGSGTIQFQAGPFEMRFSGTHNSSIVKLSMRGLASQNNVRLFGSTSSVPIIYKMGPGEAIKSRNIRLRHGFLAERNLSNSKAMGSFLPGADGAATGYVGFKGTNASHNYYGWLNVKVTADSNGIPTSASLVAKSGEPGVFGAYEVSTAPDINSFGAGQTAAVPEPADAALGLGLLAFGATGVREMRRRKHAA